MLTKQSLLFVLAAGWTFACFAQERPVEQFLFVDDWTNQLLSYWVNSGQTKLPFVLNQPYRVAQANKALPAVSQWSTLVRAHLSNSYARQGWGKLRLYARDNVALTSGKLPARRPSSAARTTELMFFKNKSQNHFNLAPQVHLALPHATFVNRTMINSEYRDDPLYAGDNSESLFGRVNDAFLNLNAGPLSLFAGRMHRNWGVPGSPGLILSDNAYTFDHLQLSYTTGKVKFSMLVSRLEDILAISDEVPDSLLDSRRYITAHRFDFSPSSKFQFALSEVAMYGGPGQDFELALLNPMNLFYLVQRNGQVQLNGLWALDIFYKPANRLNLYLQLLLDDLIVNNEPGIDDRAQSPDRLGINLRASSADLIASGLQTGLELTRIWNRTYHSRRTWENFHYRGKSLGFPVSSTERGSVFVKYFGLFPAFFSGRFSYERNGNVSPTDLFPVYTKEPFPIGPVERVTRFQFEASYFLNTSFRLTALLSHEMFKNYNNEQNLNGSRTMASLGLHVNWGLARVAAGGTQN